jgi:hypothetical protein
MYQGEYATKVASCVVDGGAVESSRESRSGSADILRDVQCPRDVYLNPSRPITVRPRPLSNDN